MSDQIKHGGQPVAAPALLKMPKPKHLRRQMRKDGGYDMVPAYTVDEMQEYARAIAAAESTQPQRECGCGWIGNQDDCAWCGSVGPLCPKCHETTEVSQQPAIAQPVAVLQNAVRALESIAEGTVPKGLPIREFAMHALANCNYPPSADGPEGWREAATAALRFIEANAGHDQLCGVFDLDDEGRHKTCTCGMEDAIKKLRATLSAAQKDPRQAFAEHHLGTPFSAPDALADIATERRRQIEVEGWTPESDDKYGQHTLSSAAGSYAMHTLAYPAGDPPPTWPWAASWWKPSEDPRRNWVKAGALIVAEIERHDRAARAEQKAPACTPTSPS